MRKDDYEVGFGRPPKHARFVKGESGNKGRKKKRPEFQTELIARIRDERVTINGVSMTMFELAFRGVIQNTIKRGTVRDLTALMELLQKYGAVPQAEAAAEARAAGEKVIQKLWKIFDRTHDIDPEDVVELDKLAAEEAAIVMKCPTCSPPLRQRWNLPKRRTLGERYGTSGLQKDVETLKKRRSALGAPRDGRPV